MLTQLGSATSAMLLSGASGFPMLGRSLLRMPSPFASVQAPKLFRGLKGWPVWADTTAPSDQPPKRPFLAPDPSSGSDQRRLTDPRWRLSKDEFPRSAACGLLGSCAKGVMISTAPASWRSVLKLRTRRTSVPKISLVVSIIWLQVYEPVSASP